MTKVAWIKNPTVATGQDHLGVRAPCEYVYSHLIPGITNVTNRARYYTFYPWLIWAIEQHNGSLKQGASYEIIRRGDCLFTLIGIYHQNLLDSPNDALHDGLTGWRKLSSVIREFLDSGSPIQISKFATTENTADRYFMNKLGGLGQYYLGPLSDAGILKRGGQDELVYTLDRGLPIAEAFDSGVDRAAFFDVLERDTLTIDDLDKLVSFCPCELKNNKNEQTELSRFLFNQTGVYSLAESENRPTSLLLILNLIKHLQHTDDAVPIGANGVSRFLGCAYRGSFPDSTPWENAGESLHQNVQSWKQYYANELLGFAVQTLFWAGLSKLSDEEILLADSSAFGDWFVDSFFDSADPRLNASVTDVINRTFGGLQGIAEWSDENHEVSLVWEIHALVAGNPDATNRAEAVSKAVELLLALAARWTNEQWETVFSIALPAGYERSYPVNIFTFLRRLNNDWHRFSLREWIAWLAAEWGIETHLQIALRKMRYESLDTFKIIPSETGLRVLEPSGAQTVSTTLRPGFTNPRVRQSMQMLLDIGAIEMDDRCLSVTDFGESFIGGSQ